MQRAPRPCLGEVEHSDEAQETQQHDAVHSLAAVRAGSSQGHNLHGMSGMRSAGEPRLWLLPGAGPGKYAAGLR